MSGQPPGDRSSVVRFGVFEVDLRTGELRKRGVRLRLQQQPFRVLEILLERHGEVVLRDELRQRLWPSDTWVDFDHGLNKAVNKLREALGDSADSPRFIETLAKRGYRFVAPIEIVQAAPEADAVEGLATPAAAADGASGQTSLDPPGVRPAPASRGPVIVIRIGALLILLSVAVLGVVAFLSWRQGEVARARAMLAILPFENLDGDPAEDYLVDGLTEEMIQQLSRLSPARLGVIARTSSMHYKGSQKRVDEIADELRVEYVLEGSVRRAGERIRVSARLIARDHQTPLWAETYDRDTAHIFEVQSDVAVRIAESLAIELLPASMSTAVPRGEVSAEVYDAYLKGRFYWNRRTPFDLERAVALLEDAHRRDPRYVPAAAALADALNVLPWYGLRLPSDVYPRSKDVAQRALLLDESSAEAHTALAYAHHYFDWNWEDAEREYARALALNPNYAQAHQWLAAHYAELGRIDDGLASMRRAERLDPHSLIIQAALGWINYLGRRFDRAREQLERTLLTEPEFVPARLWLAQTLEASGRPADAIEHAARVRRAGGLAGLGELARAYAAAGRRDEARAALNDLLAAARGRYVEADLVARVYEALGEPERALDWLERGFDERAAKMVLIGVDPQFDRLRGSARFEGLLERLRLPRSDTKR